MTTRTRVVEFDMALGSTGAIYPFRVEVTRDDSSDLGPEYRCKLLSGDVGWDDLDDMEAAAIDVAEDEWASVPCPQCGELALGLVTATYDAMVDGPGAESSEDMCGGCVAGKGRAA